MRELKAVSQRLMVPLVAICFVELLTYRLIGPALRPDGDHEPGFLHELLENFGLFTFHMSTVLTGLVLVLAAFHSRGGRGLSNSLGLLAGALSLISIGAHCWSAPPAWLELALQISYGGFLVAVVFIALRRSGALGPRIGVLVFSLPLFVHVWTPLALRWYGPEALFDGLPTTALTAGQWTVVAAALLSPYVFCPRPAIRALIRPAPWILAIFVAILATYVLGSHFEAGVMLSSLGLGFEISREGGEQQIAAALIGLATLSWTVLSCIVAQSRARREIGVALLLLIIAGYSFQWPSQYLYGALAMLWLGRAAAMVGDEEKASRRKRAFTTPSIPTPVWQQYIAALSKALEGDERIDNVSTSAAKNSTSAETRLRLNFEGRPIHIVFKLQGGAIHELRIIIAELGTGEAPWALMARDQKPRKVRDPSAAFSSRFSIRDIDELGDDLLGDGLEQQLAQCLHGSLELWPGQGLRYGLSPGQGSPIDTPIPITALSFRGFSSAEMTSAMVDLVAVLVKLDKKARSLAIDSVPDATTSK